MDKKQFAKIAVAIKAAYPASKILEDNASMDFWFLMLKDIEYAVAENAALEHISTNIYPPNIAEIRRLCMERCRPKLKSFDEAWQSVREAMSEFGFYNPKAAMESMDEITAAVVEALG